MTRARCAALLLVLAMVFAACAGTDDRSGTASPGGDASDQTLTIQLFQPPRSFDPVMQRGPSVLVGLYSAPLLRLAPGGTDVTDFAAESYEVSEDELTYTFQLKPDGRYNDGRPVVAEDFVYAWKRLIDPRVAAPDAATFASVIEGGQELMGLDPQGDASQIDQALDSAGLSAPDDRTFVVQLARPATYFKYLAAQVQGSPVRRDVIEEHGDSWAANPETLITNGPFRLASVDRLQASLEANQNHAPAPKLEKVVGLFGGELSAIWAKYLNDELDIAQGPDPAAIPEARRSLPDQYKPFLTPELSVIGFNTTQPPFDNPSVRLAFAKAINREQLAGEVLKGCCKPMTSLIPEGVPGYDPTIGDAQAFDPAEAKALLDSSGVSPDQLNGVAMVASASTRDPAIYVQAQLAENLGVDVSIEVEDGPAYQARLQGGDYQMYAPGFGLDTGYPDPEPLFTPFLPGAPRSFAVWEDAEYTRLVQEAQATSDSGERLDLFKQAERVLIEEAPVAFMFQYGRSDFIKPWVQGIKSTAPFDLAQLPGYLYSTEVFIEGR